jgi:hypothetical protein
MSDPNASPFFDFGEIVLFTATMSMVVLIIFLFHYSAIQKDVKKKSRCIRERELGESGGIYSVHAMNEYNDKLYSIEYDLMNKDYTVSCACSKGDVANNFQNIKVYNMRNPSAPVMNIPSKTCYCERNIESDNISYKGYPGLIDFMYRSDISFFKDLDSK